MLIIFKTDNFSFTTKVTCAFRFLLQENKEEIIRTKYFKPKKRQYLPQYRLDKGFKGTNCVYFTALMVFKNIAIIDFPVSSLIKTCFPLTKYLKKIISISIQN